MKGRIYWLEHLDLDGSEIDAMLTAPAERGVTIDPTLITYPTKFRGNDPRYLAHPEQALVPPPILDGWRQGTFTSGWTEADYRRAQAAWPKVLGLTKRLFDRGVLLTAGSDLPNPWVIPGVSFHVVLRANPLDDIRNTRSIAWVIQGGMLFKPDSLREAR